MLADNDAVRRVVRDAARASLDADVRPVDLSTYESTPDAGTLAGANASARAGAGARAGGSERLAPGSGPQAAAQVAQLKDALSVVGGSTSQLGSDPLGQLMTDTLDVCELAERAQVFILADAISRGIVAESNSGSPRQWLTDRAPHLEPGQASRVVAAANAINQPRNAALRAALDAGEISARALVVALREVEKAHAVLPEASRLDVLGYYLAVAHAGTSEQLKRLTKRIVAAFGRDDPNKETKARGVESLRWSELPGGMTRVQAELSPGHAAMFASAIEALASPRRANHDTNDNPGSKGKGKGNGNDAPAELRSVGKRRADALMELINGVSRVTDADAGKAAARVNVTIPLSALVGDLIDAGYGTTTLGHLLDAGTCRTMACNAQLVPVVLGTRSEPLDIGRAAHPFSTAARTAITHRDSAGCTFPGCDRPAPWCEAHHAVPWWVGGHSDLANGTLLCGRHHHIVHANGYMPWITETLVIWDLIPDRMPTQMLHPDDPLAHGPGAPPDHAQTG